MIEVVTKDYNSFRIICQEFHIREQNATFIDSKFYVREAARKEISQKSEKLDSRPVLSSLSDLVCYNQGQ